MNPQLIQENLVQLRASVEQDISDITEQLVNLVRSDAPEAQYLLGFKTGQRAAYRNIRTHLTIQINLLNEK